MKLTLRNTRTGEELFLNLFPRPETPPGSYSVMVRHLETVLLHWGLDNLAEIQVLPPTHLYDLHTHPTVYLVRAKYNLTPTGLKLEFLLDQLLWPPCDAPLQPTLVGPGT